MWKIRKNILVKYQKSCKMYNISFDQLTRFSDKQSFGDMVIVLLDWDRLIMLSTQTS